MNAALLSPLERAPQAPVLPPVEAHSLIQRPGQHDQNSNTAGVYKSANAYAEETQAHFSGDLPETAERREESTIRIGLGSIAARGVAMAPEESYAEEFKTLRGHFYNSHVAYLEELRKNNEFYAHHPSQESDDDEEDPNTDDVVKVLAKARAKGHGPARFNSLHDNPN